MRIKLTSPFDQSVTAEVVISDETGKAVLESGEGNDLVVLIDALNAFPPNGGAPPWAPAREEIIDWAEARGIAWAEYDRPDFESDPDVVY